MRRLLAFRIPCPEPIGLPAGMTAAAPASFNRRASDRVVGRVAQHLEPFRHQLLGRLQGGDGIGQQRLAVAQHFQLDPVGTRVLQPRAGSRGPAAPCEPHPRPRSSRPCWAAGCSDRVSMKSRMFWPCSSYRPFAAHGHGNAVRSGQFQRFGHQRKRGVLAGPHNQSTLQRVIAHSQRVLALILFVHRQLSIRDRARSIDHADGQ